MKITALILACLLVFSMTVNVFAENGIGNNGTDSSDVKGTYNKNETAKVYSVDIAWEGLSFTYNSENKGIWNAETHEYEGATEAGWSEGTGKITVTNHSNTSITATPVYTPKIGFASTGMQFDSTALTVATADNGTDGGAGTPVVGTIIVTPTGTLPEGTVNTTIGTITITIE